MLKVVSNTTPLISLLKLGRLDVLMELYQEILIPTGVYEEIEAGKNKSFYRNLSKIDWVKIIKIENEHATRYFLDLDKGEAEAIILATEVGADLIIMDEKLGRFHAKHADLKVTGTVGVLIKAKREGIINELKPLLFELRAKDVWISEKFIDEILSQVHEK